MIKYTETMRHLIDLLGKIPGIGVKSAERIAFHMLQTDYAQLKDLAETMLKVKKTTKCCKICSNFSEEEICEICADEHRDHSKICVIEEPADIASIEKTKSYNGVYHVLLGAISPLEGVSPASLKIKDLIERVKNGKINEVIIATNSDTEGEITALYLTKLLKPLCNNITRIAFGMPVGSAITYLDQATLTKALDGRRAV